MFRGLINDAKSAAGSVVAKYAVRVSVAVPFIIALGFATAGVTLMLVERFGHRNAYLIVAGGFTAVGLLAVLIVRTKEHEEVVADVHPGNADTKGVATDDAAAAAAAQMPLALLGTLFSSPLGPSSVLSIVRVLGRNLPLVVMLVAMATLFWPKSGEETAVTQDIDPGPLPNGAYPAAAPQEAA